MPSHFDRALNTLGNIATHVGNTVGTVVNEQLSNLEKKVKTMSLESVNLSNLTVVEKAGEFQVLPKGGNLVLATQIFGIGLGWDASRGGANFDLDASCLLLNAEKQGATSTPVIYYGVKEDARNSIKHSGDNLTGEGAGDDEVILVDCTKLDPSVTEIAVIINIYQAASKNQNFGQVSNSYVRLFDVTTGEVFVRYDLNEDYSVNTGVFVGKIYLNNGAWKFKAVGTGVNGSIADIAKQVASL